MGDTGEETPLASPLSKGGSSLSSPLSKGGLEGGLSAPASYTHAPLGREVEALAGYYVIGAENRLSFEGREVLVATGHMIIDNACCGAGGCGFALVPGYVLRWKAAQNEKGEPVTEVEPIREEREKEALRTLILQSERVQQVNFW
jgi:hypothetical protein